MVRPDGVLTVMFTHKKQEAWESLFQSLIEAGFTITATWPVKTEGAHTLHQANRMRPEHGIPWPGCASRCRNWLSRRWHAGAVQAGGRGRR